jgi:hypothetical protein
MAADEFRFSQLMTANEAENIAPQTSEEDVVSDVGNGKYDATTRLGVSQGWSNHTQTTGRECAT